MNKKAAQPRIPSTRTATRSAAASLTGKTASPAATATKTSPAAAEAAAEAAATAEVADSAPEPSFGLRHTKPEPIKPRQFRVYERIFEDVQDACEQLGCTQSAFANTAFETLLAALRKNGEIK